MKSKYDYEIIRDYLHGLVDTKTSKEIGELIKRDETARSIAEGIVRLEKKFTGTDAEVDKYLNEFRQKQMDLIIPPKPSSATTKIWFRVAASLLLLIGISMVIRLMTTSPDLQALVGNELGQPYPLASLVRGESDAASERAFQLYSQGDYVNASIYFEKSFEGKDNASFTFYNALSHLYVGNYERAIVLLKSDVVVNSRYAAQGQWYQALALIRSGDKDKAREILENIVDNKQHFKYETASEMLECLR